LHHFPPTQNQLSTVTILFKFRSLLFVKAYHINETTADGMKKHAMILDAQIKLLAGLIQRDATAREYCKPISVIEEAQVWYEAHAARAKRLCAAAKREDKPAKVTDSADSAAKKQKTK